MCVMGKALYGDAAGIRVLGLEADADALMGGGVTSLLAFAVGAGLGVIGMLQFVLGAV